MNVTVQIKGLAELQKKLGVNFLLTPEVEHVRDAFVDRIGRRRRTKGFIRNPLAVQNYAIAMGNRPIARVTTPLNNPRTTGAAWLRFIYSLARGAFMRNQLNAAVRRIQARWGS